MLDTMSIKPAYVQQQLLTRNPPSFSLLPQGGGLNQQQFVYLDAANSNQLLQQQRLQAQHRAMQQARLSAANSSFIGTTPYLSNGTSQVGTSPPPMGSYPNGQVAYSNGKPVIYQQVDQQPTVMYQQVPRQQVQQIPQQMQLAQQRQQQAQQMLAQQMLAQQQQMDHAQQMVQLQQRQLAQQRQQQQQAQQMAQMQLAQQRQQLQQQQPNYQQQLQQLSISNAQQQAQQMQALHHIKAALSRSQGTLLNSTAPMGQEAQYRTVQAGGVPQGMTYAQVPSNQLSAGGINQGTIRVTGLTPQQMQHLKASSQPTMQAHGGSQVQMQKLSQQGIHVNRVSNSTAATNAGHGLRLTPQQAAILSGDGGAPAKVVPADALTKMEQRRISIAVLAAQHARSGGSFEACINLGVMRGLNAVEIRFMLACYSAEQQQQMNANRDMSAASAAAMPQPAGKQPSIHQFLPQPIAPYATLLESQPSESSTPPQLLTQDFFSNSPTSASARSVCSRRSSGSLQLAMDLHIGSAEKDVLPDSVPDSAFNAFSFEFFGAPVLDKSLEGGLENTGTAAVLKEFEIAAELAEDAISAADAAWIQATANANKALWEGSDEDVDAASGQYDLDACFANLDLGSGFF